MIRMVAALTLMPLLYMLLDLFANNTPGYLQTVTAVVSILIVPEQTPDSNYSSLYGMLRDR